LLDAKSEVNDHLHSSFQTARHFRLLSETPQSPQITTRSAHYALRSPRSPPSMISNGRECASAAEILVS
jgi:hypothetical protein